MSSPALDADAGARKRGQSRIYQTLLSAGLQSAALTLIPGTWRRTAEGRRDGEDGSACAV